MGFLLPQFLVGERVMVRDDARHPKFRVWAGWIGAIIAQSHKFRTWHGNQISYDYSYRVRFERPAHFDRDDALVDLLVDRSRSAWIPGRQLVACTTTLLQRKDKGSWRDTSEDGMKVADFIPPLASKPEEK